MRKLLGDFLEEKKKKNKKQIQQKPGAAAHLVLGVNPCKLPSVSQIGLKLVENVMGKGQGYDGVIAYLDFH